MPGNETAVEKIVVFEFLETTFGLTRVNHDG